jgi:hypothetical protein
MDWQFGYNCKHFLPTLDKCRKLIDDYRPRQELKEFRNMIKTEELLAYSNLTNDDLVRQIASGEIKVQRLKKDGTLKFGLSTSWSYDDCPLAHAGGQCIDFAPHQGTLISCLAERNDIGQEHPNTATLPSNEDVAVFEKEVIRTMGL